MAAASWDGSCRIWEFNDSYSSSRFLTLHQEQKEAVLRCLFSPDSDILYFGNTKGEIKALNYGQSTKTTPSVVCPLLESPVTGLKACTEKACVVAGSMGGAVVVFDPKSKDNFLILHETQNSPIVNIDVGQTMIYFATAGRAVRRLDLRNPNQKAMNIECKIPSQITSIACNTQGNCCIAGSTCGFVEMMSDDVAKYNQYRCHRSDNARTMTSSNMVSVSREKDVGMSVGGDGTVYFFNLMTPKKPRETKVTQIPLTACTFAPKGGVVAVASGYDWSRGAEFYKKEKLSVEIIVKKLGQNDIP